MPEGIVIVGCPKDTPPERARYARLGVEQWLADPNKPPLTFPWPVDVRDLRK